MLLNRFEFMLMNNRARAMNQRHVEAGRLVRMGRGAALEIIFGRFGAEAAHGLDSGVRTAPCPRATSATLAVPNLEFQREQFTHSACSSAAESSGAREAAGEGLSDRPGRGPMPMGESLATARMIAAALEAAQEKGIVHWDLTPANVKIAADGTVKVLRPGRGAAGRRDFESDDLAHASGSFPTITAEFTRPGVKWAMDHLRLQLALAPECSPGILPEGLAAGVAFWGVIAGTASADLAGAIALAVGIGIHDFPEGVAVAVPLRQAGTSWIKSFWYGQLSAAAEPVAAVAGAAAVIYIAPILPYALAFAAGAMVFVLVEELIRSRNGRLCGPRDHQPDVRFAVMMTLDVALG